jgi:hypothetical protein
MPFGALKHPYLPEGITGVVVAKHLMPFGALKLEYNVLYRRGRGLNLVAKHLMPFGALKLAQS